ncbi:hypothetical protein [Shewanella surugensis]|uniref:Uncharacterized protein n=1 Tax=Shewanella surugensis TaxID=212020 RepID=A0ABT0L722_9GAMM|nr:hypothetical protein [Shewanella surugensis]MCL1123483.1 hypothetical protein [Shewanella surugensis]
MAQYDVNNPSNANKEHTFNHSGYKIVANQSYSFTLGTNESVVLGATVGIHVGNETYLNLGLKQSIFVGQTTDVNVSWNLSFTNKLSDVKIEEMSVKGLATKATAEHKEMMADKMSAVLAELHLKEQHLSAIEQKITAINTNIDTTNTHLATTNTNLDTANTRIDTSNTAIVDANTRMDNAQVHMALNSMCISSNQIAIEEAESIRMLESGILMLD